MSLASGASRLKIGSPLYALPIGLVRPKEIRGATLSCLSTIFLLSHFNQSTRRAEVIDYGA